MKAAQALIFAYGAVVVVALVGWVLNIVALTGMDWDAGLTIEAVMRIVGIPFVPLGAVLGFFM